MMVKSVEWMKGMLGSIYAGLPYLMFKTLESATDGMGRRGMKADSLTLLRIHITKKIALIQLNMTAILAF